MKRRIAILPITALVVASLAAASVARMHPKREPTLPPAAPPASEFEHAIAAVGLIESSSENVRIGSHLSGIVDAVFVRAGDDVDAGAPLFRLETRHLCAERAHADAADRVARAGVDVAKAALADVRDQLAIALAIRDKRAISRDDLQRREHAVATAEAQVTQAEAAVDAAEAERKRVEVEIERSTVCAPITGRILKVDIRAGEFAAAGALTEPLIVLGNVRPLCVRVDVDEHEAARVRPEADAVAMLRGDASIRSPLRFVRFEPLVVPKRALTGDSAERVDTRVLQALYRLEREDRRFHVGLQMDVFIEGEPRGLPGASR